MHLEKRSFSLDRSVLVWAGRTPPGEGGKGSSGGSRPPTSLQRSDRTPTALRPPGTNQSLKRDLSSGAWPQRASLLHSTSHILGIPSVAGSTYHPGTPETDTHVHTLTHTYIYATQWLRNWILYFRVSISCQSSTTFLKTVCAVFIWQQRLWVRLS